MKQCEKKTHKISHKEKDKLVNSDIILSNTKDILTTCERC